MNSLIGINRVERVREIYRKKMAVTNYASNRTKDEKVENVSTVENRIAISFDGIQ